MPLTRLANSIIDGVDDQPAPVAAEIAKYLESDLLFYRATSPAELTARQRRHWDPILAWAAQDTRRAVRLYRGRHPHRSAASGGRCRARRHPGRSLAFGRAHTATTLTGSALIALALARGALSVDAAWQAANVDEDWNMEQWGRDELALERRDFRFAELKASALVLSLLSESYLLG